MNITKVVIWPMHEQKLRAYATITIDEEFVVKDLRVIEGDKGLFVAMPNKKLKDGKFIDVAHPINAQSRMKIETAVIDAYNKKIKEIENE